MPHSTPESPSESERTYAVVSDVRRAVERTVAVSSMQVYALTVDVCHRPLSRYTIQPQRPSEAPRFFRGQLEEPKVRPLLRPCLVPGGRPCSEER